MNPSQKWTYSDRIESKNIDTYLINIHLFESTIKLSNEKKIRLNKNDQNHVPD